MKKKTNKKIVAFVASLTLMVSLCVPTPVVKAAALTSLSDTLSTLKAAEVADHTILWTLPSTITFDAGDQARIDFPDGFVTSAASWATTDFTFNDGTARTVESIAVDGAPTCTAGANNIGIRINPTTDEFIIIACTSYTSSGATASVTFTIDGTATEGTLTNPSAEEYLIGIVGDDKGDGFGANDDTGSITAIIIDDDQVAVSAVVNATLSFDIPGDNTIGFGTLTSSGIRYATDTTGSDSESSAHTITAGTNSTSGYSITVEGATLDAGTPDIAPIGGTATALTAGSEQFGIRISSTGGACDNAEVDPYNHATNYAYDAVAAADQIISCGSASATTTFSIYYGANIAANTEAGNYTAALTYIATGNF